MKKLTCSLLICVLSFFIGTASASNLSFKNFSKKFCALNTTKSHIIATDATLFKQGKVIKCHNKNYKMRYRMDHSDHGHGLFNIDPPTNTKAALDCDGKADTGMKVIAVNCYPVSLESPGHGK